MTNTNKALALQTFLGSDFEAEQSAYCENTFECDGEEWLVVTDSDADDLVAENIRDSIWAFRAEFLWGHICAHLPVAEIVRIQESMCEDANGVLTALIDDMDELISDAISQDGRGHFLSGYDGDEIEMGDFYAYRTN